MFELIKELGDDEKILRTYKEFRNFKKYSKLRNPMSRKMRKVLKLVGSRKTWGFMN